MANVLSAEIKILQTHFADGLRKRLDDFNATYKALQQDLDTPKSLQHIQTLEAAAHSLSGASGTFMFHETHCIAKVLEAECLSLREQNKPIKEGAALEILSLIKSLNDAIKEDLENIANENGSSENSKVAEEAEKTINVLLVEDDKLQASALKLQMANLGLHTELAETPEKIRDIDFSANDAPDIILMDIMFGGDHDAGLRIVQEMRDKGLLNIPVIFISARDDFNARLHAIRCNSDGYIAKPIDVLEITETIKRLLSHPFEKNESYDVLIIGADDEVKQGFAATLANSDMNCRFIENPEDTLDTLENHSPHVILINNVLPTCSGTELSTLIRQVNNTYARIPIVFFADEAPDKQRLLDLRAAGDDMLVLPVDPNIFMLSLHARCKRTRDMRDIIKQRQLINQRYNALSENVNSAVITTNADHRIIFWNNTAEQLFGYQAADTIGMHISMVFAKEHHEEIIKHSPHGLIQTTHSTPDKSKEMYGITAIGVEFPIEVTATKWARQKLCRVHHQRHYRT